MSGSFGRGEAIGHAGEILQGAIGNEAFLVTLPAPVLQSTATAEPVARWCIDPGTKWKALRAAQMATAAWGVSAQFRLQILSAIPEGRGCGSSTSDCVAAVRAVANCLGRSVSEEETATHVHAAEAASDSTMYGESPVVFLPRRGVLLRRIEGGWPPTHVTVFDLGGPPVDTLSIEIGERPEHQSLLEQLEGGFFRRDLQCIAEVATASAHLQQEQHPRASWRPIYHAAIEAGALGVAVAHSGNVAAALSRHPLDLPALYRYQLGDNSCQSFS
ncbi:hypothetical protein [Bryobacter aggregatus]|uniref:GHMP family kinase ATP-binding protein n=1 Tax=Bryobacter aggregatus TaxID=360054 RepID=UPI00068E68A7|nr:hypothetical protein [Bryobacter aggregatus]